MRKLVSFGSALVAFSLLIGTATAASAVRVTVTSPTYSSVNTSFLLNAAATSSNTVTGWSIYVDDIGVWNTPGPASSILVPLTVSAGEHSIVVKAWDSSGGSGYQRFNISASTTSVSVSVQSPLNGGSVSSPVTFRASGSSTNGISGWVIYVDGRNAYRVDNNSNSLTADVPVGKGLHSVYIRAWDKITGYGTSPTFFINVPSPSSPSATASSAGSSSTSPATAGSTGTSSTNAVSAGNTAAGAGSSGSSSTSTTTGGTANAGSTSATTGGSTSSAGSGGTSTTAGGTANAGSTSATTGGSTSSVGSGGTSTTTGGTANAGSTSATTAGGTSSSSTTAGGTASSGSTSTTAGGSTTSPTTGGTLPTPPPTAAVFQDIQNMTGFKSCSANCAGGQPTTNYFMAQFQGTPSLSGSSVEFFNGGSAWANVLWYKSLGANNSASHFLWDFYVYYDSTSIASLHTAEFDLYQSINGIEFMVGSQCNFGDGDWNTWNQATDQWINTTIPCQRFSPETWHHIQWYVERVSSTQYRYVTLVVDDTRYSVDQIYSGNFQGWADTLGVQWQLDLGADAIPAHEWVDKAQLTIW